LGRRVIRVDLNLKGKVAIVTGGASNIGRAISLGFAKEGAQLVLADIDIPQGEKVVKEAESLGCQPILIETDVTNNKQVEEMVGKTINRLGRIDILVNNVGWGFDRPFLEKRREEWQKEVEINFWGTLNYIRAVIGHMVERKYGKIINIGSDAGRMGEYNEEVYSACKGAVISLSKSLARGFGRHGININVVCPGATNPEDPSHFGEKSMWASEGFLSTTLNPEVMDKIVKKYPLRKLGKPQDIANAVLFLSSDVAGQITGQTLSVSGGYTMF
jgi:2-hydroxycyclohexanecarboxyl-CoA dehydrogenase